MRSLGRIAKLNLDGFNGRLKSNLRFSQSSCRFLPVEDSGMTKAIHLGPHGAAIRRWNKRRADARPDLLVGMSGSREPGK